jgi:hypothetical protein
VRERWQIADFDPERGAELAQRRQPPPLEHRMELLARALDDRRPCAHLPGEPDRLSRHGRSEPIARRADQLRQQLALSHEAEDLGHACGARPFVHPLREAREHRAQMRRSELPHGAQLVGLVRRIRPMQKLAPHGTQPVVALSGGRRGRRVRALTLHRSRQPLGPPLEVNGAHA